MSGDCVGMVGNEGSRLRDCRGLRWAKGWGIFAPPLASLLVLYHIRVSTFRFFLSPLYVCGVEGSARWLGDTRCRLAPGRISIATSVAIEVSER